MAQFNRLVAAFLTAHRTDDRWHCYQCKHYEKALTPAIAYAEILKIIAVVAGGKYRTLPERYVFVAPRIGASLTQLLAKPAELKETFLDWVAKGTDRRVAASTISGAGVKPPVISTHGRS